MTSGEHSRLIQDRSWLAVLCVARLVLLIVPSAVPLRAISAYLLPHSKGFSSRNHPPPTKRRGQAAWAPAGRRDLAAIRSSLSTRSKSCCRRVKELDASKVLQLLQVSRGRLKATLGHGAAVAHQLHHHLRRSARGPHPGPGGALECHRRISMRASCSKRRPWAVESVGLGTPAKRSAAGRRYLDVRWPYGSALHAASEPQGGFA